MEEQIEDKKDEPNFQACSTLSLASACIYQVPPPVPHPYSRIFSPDGLKRERQLPMKRNINDFLPSDKSCGALRWDSLAPFQDPSQSFIANAPTNASPYSPTHEQ